MRLFLACFFPCSVFSLSPLQRTKCTIQANNSLTEAIKMCQGINDISIWGFQFKGLSEANFNRIFSNATHLRGNMDFPETRTRIMSFSRLGRIGFNGEFEISHNSNLEEIRFPLLTFLSAATTFSNNPKLRTLEFPLLEALDLDKTVFCLEDNPLLKAITFPSMIDAGVGKFIVRRNRGLEMIKSGRGPDGWDVLARFKVYKYFIIEDNESLKEIRIEKDGMQGYLDLLEKRNLYIIGGPVMDIINNRALTALPPLYRKRNTTMRIRGNPLLSREVLTTLRDHSNRSSSEFQEFGECMFKEPVTNLALLDICVYVYGQLELTASAEGWTSVRLDRVEGDVFTSEVPIDRLAFLVDTEIHGKFESSLCDFDFSGFKAGKKGSRRRCQTTKRQEEEATTTGGEISTKTIVDSRTIETKTTEITTREARTPDKTSTVTRETVETTTTATEMGRETTEMTKETTTEERSSHGEIGKTSMTGAAGSFPYLPVIIVSVVVLVFLILLGIFLWMKKRKIKQEKPPESSRASQKSTVSKKSMSSQSSR